MPSGRPLPGEYGEHAAGDIARVAGDDSRIVASDTVEGLWPMLMPRMQPDAVILLKASRGVQLERLVPHLTNWANP